MDRLPKESIENNNKMYLLNPTVSLDSDSNNIFEDEMFNSNEEIIKTNFISITGDFEVSTEIDNEKPVLLISNKFSNYGKIKIGFKSFDDFKKAMNLIYFEKEPDQVNSNINISPVISHDRILYNKKKYKHKFMNLKNILIVTSAIGILGLKKYLYG